MKKILIAGTGSIGSEIAYLFSNEYEVICVDHGKYFQKIKEILPKVKLIKGDIYDYDLMKSFHDVDIVFYCIDTGGVVSCIDYYAKYYDINITKFKKFINSFTNSSSHFYLFSSCYVYPDVLNITEDTKLNPETQYGVLRANQEKILVESGIKYTILRLSNIFGYGNFFHVGNFGAIEKFIDLVLNRGEISLHGNGEQIVNYLYKEDLMSLIKILVNYQQNKIYNISSGQSRSIHEIAKIIKNIALEEYNIHIEIIKLDENVKLPNSPCIQPNKVMQETSWKPSSDLESVIKKMMAVYLEHKR